MNATVTTAEEQATPVPMLTPSEVAAMLRLSVGSVYRMAQTAALPGHKVQGKWRFWEHEIRAAVNQAADPWRRSNQARARRRATRKAA